MINYSLVSFPRCSYSAPPHLNVFFFKLSWSPQFCHNNKKAQKYLLGGFECVVKLHQVQLLSRVPLILKDLYDADLLEEDVIFAWADKVGVGQNSHLLY